MDIKCFCTKLINKVELLNKIISQLTHILKIKYSFELNIFIADLVDQYVFAAEACSTCAVKSPLERTEAAVPSEAVGAFVAVGIVVGSA